MAYPQSLEMTHPSEVSDYIDIDRSAKATLAMNTGPLATAALSEGLYDVLSDVACFLQVSDDPVNGVSDSASGTTIAALSTSNGYFLLANNVITLLVRKNRKIGGIVASGTGTLSFHKVG